MPGWIILGYETRLFLFLLCVKSPIVVTFISTAMTTDTEPLTLRSWLVVDVKPDEEPEVPPEYQKVVYQLSDTWSKMILGMDLFQEHATWFKPETDLKKISDELGIPVVALKDYRVAKQCYGMSSFFTEVYPGFHVIEGIAIEPPLLFPTDHACLCKMSEGKLFVFDLVRDKPLFMYGVVVRPVMKKRLNERCKDTWAGYSLVNGLNYIKHETDFWD